MHRFLIHLDDSERCQQRLEVAHALSQRIESSLFGLHVYSPQTQTPYFPMVNVGGARAVTPDVMVNPAFLGWEAEKGAIEQRILSVPYASVQNMVWESVEGRRREQLIEHGYFHDLMILSRDEYTGKDLLDGVFHLSAITAVDGSCPTLMLPDGFKTNEVFSRPLLLWRDGKRSSRAMRAAMPLLVMNGQLDILFDCAIHTDPAETNRIYSKLRNYLFQHGVRADLVEATCVSSEEAVIRQLSAENNDLLIMGIHDRARLNDLILGGLERRLLSASPAPLLLAN